MAKLSLLCVALTLCVGALAHAADSHAAVEKMELSEILRPTLPKCPGICRTGRGSRNRVRRECANGKATCSAKFRTCSMMRCKKRVSGVLRSGWKCTCPKCPEACYAGLPGLQKASIECQSATCPRLSIPNDSCKVATCPTKSGKPGFKCGCAKRMLKCPAVCRAGSVGNKSAYLECAGGASCAASDTKCAVRSCVTKGGENGKECACPQLGGKECPNVCHTGADSDIIAIEDCIPKDLKCTTGRCMVRDCYKGLLPGRKCGCNDDAPLDACPNKCRFGRRKTERAEKECRKPHKCKSGKCMVRKCFDDDTGDEGVKCGCEDGSPPPTKCPNTCHMGSNAMVTATTECSKDRFCPLNPTKPRGSCKVRKCYSSAGMQGYACACNDEDPPLKACPNMCNTMPGHRAISDKECSVDRVCMGGSCTVRKCWDKEQNYREGSMCGCRNQKPPPPPCPETCDTTVTTKGGKSCGAEYRCPICDILEKTCVNDKCLTRRCWTKEGKGGFKCGCKDETRPALPCPNECLASDSSKTAEEKAQEQCTDLVTGFLFDNWQCTEGRTCEVRDCFLPDGSMGRQCGCKVNLPPVQRPCPNVCRRGRSGKKDAKEECSLKQDPYPECVAARGRGSCDVGRCRTNQNKNGWACQCAGR